MKKIISLIMCIGIIITSMTMAFAEEKEEILVTALDYFTEEDIKNTADRLFSKIDDNSNTAEIVKAYKAGEYLQALGLFRNYMIDRFRATPQEQISITGFSWDYYYLTADIMVGRMTRDELNAKYAHRADLKKVNAIDAEHILDYIDSSQPSHIVWVDRDPIEGDERLIVHNDYTHGITVLACRYVATGDPIFLQKALQIMEDIADNYPKQVDEFYGITDLSFEERGYMAKTLGNDVYMYNKEGSRGASYNVNKAQRSNSFWWTLNILAKGLPGGYEHEGRTGNYHNKLLPMVINEKPSQEGYNLIDPVRFAKFITLILEKEYPAMTKSVLDKPGGTLNIELEAKRNSLKYAAILKDFSGAINEFLPDLIASVNQRMSETTYIDGGALETSFNYNNTDIGGREEYAKTINALAPEFVEKYGLEDFSQQAIRYQRLKELYSSPLGLLSRIGNVYSVFGTPPIWKDEAKLEKFKETLGVKEQAYKSAYLPYSGYGSMRSGWDIDDFYMSFYNNDRFTAGHGFMGRNAVMNLTAYGRTLLMCGGVAYYGLSYVTQYPEFVEFGYDEINPYFSEDSTRKASTVMVNDKSQSRRGFFFDEVGDYDAAKNAGANKWGTIISANDNRIMRSRWLTDEHYDFAEGTFDGGYTYMYGKMENVEQPDAVGEVTKDAQHDRSFVYVKDADLFVVTDTMTNTYNLSNKYRALWHFPAYLESVENLSGFKDEQVVLDEENNMFYTNDAEGPNLYAYNFSSSDLSYEKYCGYLKKGEFAWGWGDGGDDATLGKFTPRPEVHVLWNDVKRGDVTKMSTVLVPSPDNTNPIASVKDNSTDELHSFELVKTDGTTVKVFNSEEKVKLEFDGMEIRAKDLIITKGADGKYKSAVALDCDYFISKNVTPMYMISKNCSVEFNENGLIGKVTQFDVPKGFKWIDTEDGKYVPSYE